MGERREQNEGAGRRVLVLWLCWLVLAVFLVAAGVVAAWSVSASEPPPPATHGSVVVSAAEPEVPATAPAAGAGDLAPPALRERAGPTAAPTTTARVRFRKGFVGNRGHYTGPVSVLVDGRTLATVQVVNRDAVEIDVPLAARTLGFLAPGWRPAASDPSLLRAGEVELPEVVFEPDAKVRFQVEGLPTDWQGKVAFDVRSDHELFVSGTSPDARAAAGAQEFPCASGQAFSWRVDFRATALHWSPSGNEPALQPGEVRTLRVPLHDLPRQRYRIVGPSRDLLPHLAVHSAPADPRQWRWTEPIAPDAQGEFERRSRDPERFLVATPDEYLALRGSAHGDPRELRTEADLLGLQLLDASGLPVASTLLGERGSRRGTPQLVHVVARERLEARLHVTSAATGTLAFATARFPAGIDFVRLCAAEAERVGNLTVHVHGKKPEYAAAGQQMLQVLASDGTLVQSLAGGTKVECRALPPGLYDLRWSCAGAEGPWIARQVEVRAGAPRELETAWPALAGWTGEVLGHREAPATQRFLSVRFGTWPHLAGGVHARLDAEGRFRLQLPEGLAPDPVVEFRWGLMHPRGEVVSVDGARRHVVVRPPADLAWVTLRADLSEPGPWQMMLYAEGRAVPWMIVQHDEQRPVAVPPGVVLAGALYDSRAAQARLVAWFEVDGRSAEVVVRPGVGRTVEVRPAAGKPGRSLALVGPRGQLDQGHACVGETPLQLFVPDGTRAVRVFESDATGRPDGFGRPAVPAHRDLPIGGGAVLIVD